MSKQIYIDSEGNEIKLSGTVNSADMLPMSASDSRKVSDVIDELDDRTPKIQFGQANVGLLSANSVTTVTINYSGFLSKPKIIACLDMVASQINNTRDITVTVNEDTVTPTSAEIDLINLSTAVYGGINWIAIGD